MASNAENHREVGEAIVFLHRLEPGGTDRSYGIHVARLAGLPADVVRRAGEILSVLESERHVGSVTAPPAPDAGQLPLFEGPHPVVQELLALEPDGMTPLEALNRLAELKRRVERT